MNIGIIGGGIGGLTAALALHRRGHRITLFERTPLFAPVGAGIVLAPNAARILEHLGVDLASAGRVLTAMTIARADGSELQRIDTAKKADKYGPTYAIPRPDLHHALEAALPSDVALRLGQPVSAVRPRPDGVTIEAEGSHDFDLLIGADGLHSRVREAVVGDWPLRYSGTTCWRGICPNHGFEHAIEAWGADARMGIVPLARDRVYYYLVQTAAAKAPSLSWPDGFRAVFGQFRGGLERLLDALPEAPPLHHDLTELDAPTWGAGRVALLGDAAHAMTPNQGQGAAMAIEDALALALCVDQPDVPGALAALRHDRVRRVQLDSRRIGAISHWGSPLARSARDTLFRMAPSSAGDAQYRAVVEPGLALLAQFRAG